MTEPNDNDPAMFHRAGTLPRLRVVAGEVYLLPPASANDRESAPDILQLSVAEAERFAEQLAQAIESAKLYQRDPS